jgi:hypothetical protein
VPGLDQAARHREAHLAEANESDFHDVIFLFPNVICEYGTLRGGTRAVTPSCYAYFRVWVTP